MTGVQRYAIVAGTSAYLQMEPLPGVPEDLRTVRGVLEDLGCTPAFEQDLLDLDTDALRRTLVDWVTAENRTDAVLVLYYSGHGSADRRRHYLMCRDSVEGQLTGTALATEDLVDMVTGHVRRVLLVVDTCHAGHGMADTMRTVAREICTSLGLRKSSWRDGGVTSFSVIAAARHRDEADDGAFSEALREGIRVAKKSAGARQEYLHLEDIVRHVNDHLAGAGLTQRAEFSTLVGDGIGFLPNKHRSRLLPDFSLDLAQQRAWLEASGTGAGDAGAELFVGRAALLDELTSWLVGMSRTDVACAVLTGAAGTGKSATLRQLVQLRRDMSPLMIPGRTATVASVLDAASTATLAGAGPPTVLIDGLDEAADAEVVARALTELIRLGSVRLLVGTRKHLLAHLPRDAWELDLDDPRWTRQEDLTTFAETILLHPHGPQSAGPYDPGTAHQAAKKIADAVYPNYLAAQVSARAMTTGKPLDPTPAEWRRQLPATQSPGTGSAGDKQDDPGRPAFRWAITRQAPENVTRLRALLRPLAYAKGDGLPLPLWSVLVAHIHGLPQDQVDLPWALDTGGPQIVEALDADGRSVYRLDHDTFAQDLRADAPPDVDQRVVAALLETVPRTEGPARDWADADTYLLRHLAAHAAEAGLLDDLLTDAGFLVWTDPAALSGLLRLARTDAAREATAIYRNCRGLTGFDQVPTRQLLLAVTALRFDVPDLTDRLITGAAGLWRPCWSTGSQASPLLLGAMAGPAVATWSITVAEIDSGPVAVTADASGAVRIWDLASAIAIGAPLGRHDGPAYCVASTDDGRFIVSGGEDGRVRCWDLTDPYAERLDAPGQGEPVTAVACSAVDGRPVAVSATRDGTVRVWVLDEPASDGYVLAERLGQVWSLAVADLTDAPIVLAGCAGGVVHSWDLATGRRRPRMYVGVDASVYSLAAEHRTGVLAAGCADGTMAILDAGTGELRHLAVQAHSGWISKVAIAVRGSHRIALSAGGDHVVRRWDIDTATEIAPPLAGHASGVTGLASATLDGRAVAITGSDDRTVRLWDIEPPNTALSSRPGHTNGVQAVLTAERPAPIAVSAGRDKTIRRWELATGNVAAPPITDLESEVWTVCTGILDGKDVLVAGLSDGSVRRWFLDDGAPLGLPINAHGTGRDKGVWSVSTGRIGDRPVFVTAGADHLLRRWDLATGEQVGPALTGHTGWVLSVAVATIKTDATVVSESADGSVSIRPDAVIVSGSADGTVSFWDLASGEHRAGRTSRRRESAAVRAVTCAVVDDTAVAISGDLDGLATVWDLSSSTPTRRIPTGHNGGIWTVAAGLVEGRPTLMTGGADHTVRTWDLASGRCLDIVVLPAGATAIDLADPDRLVVTYGWEVAMFTSAHRSSPAAPPDAS